MAVLYDLLFTARCYPTIASILHVMILRGYYYYYYSYYDYSNVCRATATRGCELVQTNYVLLLSPLLLLLLVKLVLLRLMPHPLVLLLLLPFAWRAITCLGEPCESSDLFLEACAIFVHERPFSSPITCSVLSLLSHTFFQEFPSPLRQVNQVNPEKRLWIPRLGGHRFSLNLFCAGV